MVHKLTISSVLLGITFAFTTLTSSVLARDSIHQLPSTNEMIVAYYGRPGVKALGVLGQHSLENIIPIIKAKASKYARASGNTNVDIRSKANRHCYVIQIILSLLFAVSPHIQI